MVALATMGFLQATGLSFLPPAAGGRRAMIFGAIGASLLGASSPSNADSITTDTIKDWSVQNPKKSESPRSWSGRYKDPMHPGCKRQIHVSTKGLEVFLNDGEPGCLKGEAQKKYILPTKYEAKKDTLSIDFSKKGGPKAVIAKYEDDGKLGKLVFPDGNKWTRISPPSPDILEGRGTWQGGAELSGDAAQTKNKGKIADSPTATPKKIADYI
jgi:hypothetical protein